MAATGGTTGARRNGVRNLELGSGWRCLAHAGRRRLIPARHAESEHGRNLSHRAHGDLDIIQPGDREKVSGSAYGPRLICALAVVSRGAEPGRVRSAACIDASICTCGHQQRRDTDQPRRFGWFGQQANGAGSGQGYGDEVPSQLRRMRRLAKPSQATEQSAVRPQAVGPDKRRADQIRRKLMRSRHQGWFERAGVRASHRERP